MCINFAMYTIVKLKFVFFIFYRLKQVAAHCLYFVGHTKTKTEFKDATECLNAVQCDLAVLCTCSLLSFIWCFRHKCLPVVTSQCRHQLL